MLGNIGQLRQQQASERLKKPSVSGFYPSVHVPSSISDKNSINIINKRPSNLKSADLSFEGLSLSKKTQEFAYKESVDFFSKHFGPAAKNLFDDIKQSPMKGVEFVGDKIKLSQNTTARTIVQDALYPVTYMPIDIVNSTFKLIRKIPGVPENFGKVGIFGKRLDQLNQEKKLSALSGYLNSYAEYIKKDKDPELLKSMIELGHSKVDYKKGDYSTSSERSLNRIVSGAVTAVFLSNDAYNLTRSINDNSKEADAEKKARFKQEVKRVGMTAYLTYLGLSAFKKITNKSMVASLAVTTVTCLASELFGRLTEGKPVTFISTKDAKQRADKEGVTSNNSAKDNLTSSSDSNTYSFVNDLAFKDNTKMSETFAGFKSPDNVSTQSFKGDKETKNVVDDKKETQSKKKEKSLKSMLIAYAAGSLAFGILNKRFKAEKFGEKLYNKLNSIYKKSNPDKELVKLSEKYKKFITKDSTIKKSSYDNILSTLRDDKVGMKELAEQYEKAVLKENGGSLDKLGPDDMVKLGSVNKPIIHPVLEIGIKHPFKFVKDVALLPYTLLERVGTLGVNLAKAFVKTDKSKKEIIDEQIKLGKASVKDLQAALDAKKEADKAEKALKKKEITQARNTIQYMEKQMYKKGELNKNVDGSDVANKLSRKMLYSMDLSNKSQFDNSEIGYWTRTLSNVVASYFLIADNYNTAMVKTKGEDKDLANQKAQERTVQRVSQIFYNGYIVKFFNAIFEKAYNKSLLGMSVVTVGNQILGDVVNRSSVGIPLKPCSKQEIADQEKQHIEAKGFKGKYFRAMAYVTGKKRISEAAESKKEKKA